MSLLAQLLDYANHLAVCRRGTRALARRLEALPTTLVGAKPGEARFVPGKLEPRELLIAPLSGSRVVGYRVVIEIPSPYWMNRRVLVDFSRLASCTFSPREDDEELSIDASSVQLLVEKPCVEGRRASGSDEEPKAFPEEISAVLADQAQIRADARDTKRYRWAEYHLHGDEEVWIEGALPEGPATATTVSHDDDTSAHGDGVTAAEGETISRRRLGGVGERPLWLATAPRDALLTALQDPNDVWLRALPRRPLSDRTTD